MSTVEDLERIVAFWRLRISNAKVLFPLREWDVAQNPKRMRKYEASLAAAEEKLRKARAKGNVR